jgi:hypothetical protein
MRKLLLGFLLIMTCNLSKGQKADKWPLLVLYEANHYTFYPYSESPVFALYDDGTVIFSNSKESGFTLDYSYEVLDSTSFNTLLKNLNYKKVLAKEKHVNNLVEYTSQPQNFFYYFNKDKRYANYYYGSLRKGMESRNQASKKLVELYDKLAYYTSDSAKKWTPEMYELMVQTRKGNMGVIWPDTLPDFNSSNTIMRDSIFFSLYLTPQEFQVFEKLNEKKSKGENFVINGKECFIMVRYPFPMEHFWMQ